MQESSKDITGLLESSENTNIDNGTINRMTSVRRNSMLYGYLIKHKWYGGGGWGVGGLMTPSLSGEINVALRSQKDNKSPDVAQIPSVIFKTSRTKWIKILQNIFNESYSKDTIDSWKVGIIVYI